LGGKRGKSGKIGTRKSGGQPRVGLKQVPSGRRSENARKLRREKRNGRGETKKNVGWDIVLNQFIVQDAVTPYRTRDKEEGASL